MARVDPYSNFNFLVEIEGIVQAGFADCSGLSSTVEVIEYREGGDPNTVRKLPGKVTYSDITLKWGMTTSRELYDWHLSIVNGDVPVQSKSGSVILNDQRGQEVARWNFFGAWPSKWEGPSLSAKGNETAVVSLTVSCERVVQA